MVRYGPQRVSVARSGTIPHYFRLARRHAPGALATAVRNNPGVVFEGLRDATQGFVNAARRAYSGPLQGPFGTKLPDYAFAGPPTAPRRVVRRAGPSSGGPGIYVGKVKKAKKLSKKSDAFLSKGFADTHEISGEVTDKDCCYIGYGAIAGYKVIELMCRALLRTLFQRAGMTITDPFQLLLNDITGVGGSVTGSSTIGWRLHIKLLDQETNVATWLYYDTVANESIASITGTLTPVAGGATVTPNWPQLIAAFRDYSAGGGTASGVNVREPMLLALQCQDLNTGGPVPANWRTVAQLNLRDMYVHCKSSAVIKVQNRSKSASGETGTDVVDANPVRFVKYLFNGTPRPKKLDVIFPQADAKTGVITAYGHLLTADMLEPPNAKYFWNCYKRVGDTLNPGVMKSDKVSYYVKKPLLRFLQTLRTSASSTGNVEQTLRCKYALYAFEDLLNFNASQKIAIAYEVNRLMSIYCSSGRVRFAQQSFGQSFQNSLEPA